jgi:hypothetical protein
VSARALDEPRSNSAASEKTGDVVQVFVGIDAARANRG